MQQRVFANSHCAHRSIAQRLACRKPAPFSGARRLKTVTAAENGNGHVKATTPSPATTARTIVDITQEGTLCTTSADGYPVGIPVSFALDKAGHPQVQLGQNTLQLHNLKKDARCSLQVQPAKYPARAVASVTLLGKIDASDSSAAQYQLDVEKCIYIGGLDQSGQTVEVSAEEFRAAEPDVLRKSAEDIIHNWNNERAEDVYRIVSDYLKVPLVEMNYAELLWVDSMGMYIRAEVENQESRVVRVSFYRTVLDERDVRSVITMASQISWENDRPYTPPVPSIFSDTAANN